MRGAQRRADRRGSATGRPLAKKQLMQIRVVTFNFVSTMSEQTGFHFDTPALCGHGDEHANTRSASSASDRRAGTFSEGGKYYG